MTRAAGLVLGVTALALLATAERLVVRTTAQTTPVPTFAVDPRWPALPPQWTLGQVTGVAAHLGRRVDGDRRPARTRGGRPRPGSPPGRGSRCPSRSCAAP